MTIGIRQQRQKTGALDGGLQLTLIAGGGAGDACRYDFAGFGQILLQGVDIFVIDLHHIFGGKAAETLATEKTAPMTRTAATRTAAADFFIEGFVS